MAHIAAVTPAENGGLTGTSRLRILLVEDHEIFRAALKALLEADVHLQVVGEAYTVTQALRMIEEVKPHVALTDIGLRDRSGIDLAAELSARKSPTRVLILTGYAAHEYVGAALTAGAFGYVLKTVGYDELVKGIYAVSAGQVFVSVRDPPAPAPLPPKAAEERHLHISAREREVLAFIAQGHTNKHTARVLKISIKTVEKHRGNLMRKLDLHGAAALTWYAMDHGLVVIPENFRRAVAN